MTDVQASILGLLVGLVIAPHTAWLGWRAGCRFKGLPKYDLPFWVDEFPQGDEGHDESGSV